MLGQIALHLAGEGGRVQKAAQQGGHRAEGVEKTAHRGHKTLRDPLADHRIGEQTAEMIEKRGNLGGDGRQDRLPGRIG